MDEERLDHLARILAVAPSRRRLLGFALAGTSGWHGRLESDAKRKVKQKKRCGNCGDCNRCVKGGCQPKRNGARCGDGDVCQRGVCGCQPGFESCGGACVQSCTAGQDLSANCQCVCTTQSCAGCCDGDACLPIGASQSDQQCGSGGVPCAACGANKECKQGGCDCLPGFERCDGDCVQNCTGDTVLNDSCQCACPGSKQDCGGNVCKNCCDDGHCGDQVCCSGECLGCCDDDDCNEDQVCQNGECLCSPDRDECGDVCCAARKICAAAETSLCVSGRGTCSIGANVCTDTDDTSCNGRSDCFCVQTVSGETRCVQFTDQTTCGQCDDDGDCAAFGSGAVCADSTGSNCCLDEGPNACAIPCDTDPPPACLTGADSCILGQGIPCNGRSDCFCLQHQGETRCLHILPGPFVCDECETDADCGEGAVCYIPGSPCICPMGQGVCMLDCPELDFLARDAPGSGPGNDAGRSRQSPRAAGRRLPRRQRRTKRR